MSKSIADKTLAIAKRQEAERLKSVKEEFLNIMRNEFEKRVISCNPWDTSYYYAYKNTFNEFSLKDLEAVCEDVGFNLKKGGYNEYLLSIPEWVKGQKRTQAQLMLYWSNIEINRTIKSRKDRARKISKEVLQKIKNGDFKSSKHSDYYHIIITASLSNGSKDFEDEAKRFFAKKNLQLVSINAESGIWRFDIKEN